MTDANQTDVNQAVVEPDTSSQGSHEDAQNRAPAGPSAEEQARNFKELRTLTKELAEKNRMLEEQVTQMQRPVQKQEVDEFDSLATDDIITKGQMLSREEKLEKRVEEKAYNRAMKDFHSSTAEERLESKYPDFRSVTSPENIEKLKERFPDLARSIASNKDAFSQGKAAYDLIMSMGIANRDAEVNREKMQLNAQKPQMAATGGSKTGPLDSAHLFESGQRPNLTKSLQATLRKEMEAAISGR